MDIMVLGGSLTASNSEIEGATKIFGELVLGKRRAKNTSIIVNLKEMPSVRIKKSIRVTQGCCLAYGPKRRRHRVFLIYLNKHQSREEMIKTLAHEMVHVRQMRLNILRSAGYKQHKWFGRIIDERVGKYHRLPWEQEAISCEEPMYEHYMKFLAHEQASSNHDDVGQDCQ